MYNKQLLAEERKYASYEYQIKFKTTISESRLIALGVRKIGTVFHEDQFFIPKSQTLRDSDELVRIRKEDGNDILFVYQGPVAHLRKRNRLVKDRLITNDEAERIREEYHDLITISKKRVIFSFGDVYIFLDTVDYLGSFIEFDVEKESDYGKLDALLRALDLDHKDAITFSYFELALIRANMARKAIFSLYSWFEKIAFGMSSSTMTVLGITVGLVSAHQTSVVVIGGIATIAIADSMGDAMSVYTAKRSERGASTNVALRAGLHTLWSKMVFSLSFLIWFLLFPVPIAVYVSIAWGLFILFFIHFLIAYVRGERVTLTIVKHVALALVISCIAFFIGSFVSRFQG